MEGSQAEDRARNDSCSEEEDSLSHLLNVYDDDEDIPDDADSDVESEAGPESDYDEDRIEEIIEDSGAEPVEEIKECPD